MRTHATHAGEAPVGHGRERHARGRYLEVPGKPGNVPGITHEQIAHRAYALYLARGDRDGDALGDWLAAERELLSAAAVMPSRTPRPRSNRWH